MNKNNNSYLYSYNLIDLFVKALINWFAKRLVKLHKTWMTTSNILFCVTQYTEFKLVQSIIELKWQKNVIFHWLLDVNSQRKSPQTHLLLLRLMTLSFCMSPISSGKDSNLLECRNSTVAFFQFPIWKNTETQNRKLWANKALRIAGEQTVTSCCFTCICKHTWSNVHTHLRGKLNKEVVISGKRADAGALADGRGQGFDLVETAVEFIQNSQPDAAKSRTRALIKWLH